MPKKQLYHWKFQVILPQKGAVIDLKEADTYLTLDEFWRVFGDVTDWLKDHPERRCVIRRGSKKIDLMHHLLERGKWPQGAML